MALLQLLADSRLSRNMVLGFLVPLVFVPVFDVYFVVAALLLLCVVYSASEVARTRGFDFPVFSVVTQRAAKSVSEMNGFATAPVTFALGIVFSLLVFPAPIAYAAIAVLTLGDGFACVFGVIFGKTPKRFKNCFKTVSLLFQPTYL